MNRQRARKPLPLLTAAVTLMAVLIMLTPLRRGPVESHSRQAGWVPLLNLGGVADNAAFHSLEVSRSRHQVSAVPLLRPTSTRPAP